MRTDTAIFLGMLIQFSTFAAASADVFVRVALLSPREVDWRMRIVAHQPGGKQAELFVGKGLAATAAQAGWLAEERSDWIELTSLLGKGVPSVRFLVETKPALEGKGVQARFDFATTANEAAIVRSITEHDPNDIMAFRLPVDLVKDRKWLLSIREDAQH